MKTLILTLATILGASAYADGFDCESANQNVNLKVFDKTQPQQGTRNAAIMVISDPSLSDGHKTTASFDADNALLKNSGSTYTAEVDLRFKNSDLKGRNFAGTKLGNVKFITLDVDFNYAQPLPDGAVVTGNVTVTKRNGTDDIHFEMACTRYLKGQ